METLSTLSDLLNELHLYLLPVLKMATSLAQPEINERKPVIFHNHDLDSYLFLEEKRFT